MSTIRLWNESFEFLAAQSGPAPKPGAEFITIPGHSIIAEIVKTHMRHGEGDLWITIDLSVAEWTNMHYVRRRRGGKVTKIDLEDRPCECGWSRIINTTIAWASVPVGVPS
ncbi:hypothetical protein [Mycolicibacterium komossense]|uniref:Uncharacterized protein n=1 Tax=Mycolicibacterium komossense TaxID=1779 RepID=A0ABT3CMG5_9MYCO|nr:hypothetical protein [Mycolicibacterium komossense]MCV7230691.1 hypothetical protein [Mycolicibacterium komossense]